MIYFALIVLAIIAVAYLFNRKAKNSEPDITTINKVLQHIVKVKPSEIDVTPDTPVDFGFKITWVAVKSNNPAEVAEAIGAAKTATCNWTSGMKLAYRKTSFITPPIDGWVLVIGYYPTPEDEKSIAEVEKNLSELSSKFNEAQLFGTHRGVDYHCWVKAVNGTIVRGYSHISETIWIQGEPTEIEKPLKLFNSQSEEYKKDDAAYHERDDITYPDEELVITIAEAWSVNPTTLSEREGIEGLGLIVL